MGVMFSQNKYVLNVVYQYLANYGSSTTGSIYKKVMKLGHFGLY